MNDDFDRPQFSAPQEPSTSQPEAEPHAKMDPSLKTAIFTAAFILGGLFGYNVLYPDLSGKTVHEKCEYWKYRFDNGYHDTLECKAEDSAKRLRGLYY